METEKKLDSIIAQFCLPGEQQSCIPFGNGHINDTFRLTYLEEGRSKDYILQKINHHVFQKPYELMENIRGVTEWLKRKILESGGDPERETLNIIPLRSGEDCCKSEDGEYWRIYRFIDHASSHDQAESADVFYRAAKAFGHFQYLLADYPADTLHETIPDFHNTFLRFKALQKAAEEDLCGRGASVSEEIHFAMERESLTHVLDDLQRQGKLPLRVTHNDTKLNNIMIDDRTGEAVCVIDLDTVMPGLAVNDFGDSIRTGASTAAEDEKDLKKVSLDLQLFEVFTRGFIEGCGGALTEKELEMLPMGAILMTFECGIRFLTDYLEGDHYFKIHRKDHNLDRCRTQFQLVKDMEEKLPQMKAIVERYK